MGTDQCLGKASPLLRLDILCPRDNDLRITQIKLSVLLVRVPHFRRDAYIMLALEPAALIQWLQRHLIAITKTITPATSLDSRSALLDFTAESVGVALAPGQSS